VSRRVGGSSAGIRAGARGGEEDEQAQHRRRELPLLLAEQLVERRHVPRQAREPEQPQQPREQRELRVRLMQRTDRGEEQVIQRERREQIEAAAALAEPQPAQRAPVGDELVVRVVRRELGEVQRDVHHVDGVGGEVGREPPEQLGGLPRFGRDSAAAWREIGRDRGEIEAR
jgi:hypothetical protein